MLFLILLLYSSVDAWCFLFRQFKNFVRCLVCIFISDCTLCSLFWILTCLQQSLQIDEEKAKETIGSKKSASERLDEEVPKVTQACYFAVLLFICFLKEITCLT